DVNGDGLPDLTTANSDSSTVSVLLGAGGGAFAAARHFATGRTPQSVALGDVNGDGWLDAVTANFGSNDVSVLLNAADDAAFFYVYAPERVPAGQAFDPARF